MKENKASKVRDRAMFLLLHYGIMRGESGRALELPDIYGISLQNEGYSTCYTMVISLRAGKKNKFGRRDYCAIMRNKNPEVCAIGGIGAYFFYRWMISDEPFIDFTTRDQWFFIKAFHNGTDYSKSISYDCHRSAVARVFQNCKLVFSAKTHVGRAGGATEANMSGATEDSVRRQGVWSAGSMEKCYLTSLPLETLRALAGFDPREKSYYIKRSVLDPPEDLQLLIFPGLFVFLYSMYKD
jgi:hypothetical protein